MQKQQTSLRTRIEIDAWNWVGQHLAAQCGARQVTFVENKLYLDMSIKKPLVALHTFILFYERKYEGDLIGG